MNFQNCLLQVTTSELITKDRIYEFILLVLAGLVTAFILWFFNLPGKFFAFIKKIRSKESISLWKFEIRNNQIKPGVHFNISSFKKEFFERNSYKILNDKFNKEKKNLIITGRSGLGKTRSIFEILSKSKNKFELLIPFLTRPESFNFKQAFKKRKKVILFIDDLQKYEATDINYYLENLIPNSSEVRLISTCRTEHDKNIFSSFQISNLERFELSEWTTVEGKALADLLNISFDEKQFDHTAASLIYKLEKLKEQYKQLKNHQKIILESIKLLKLLDRYCNPRSIKEIAINIFDLKETEYDTWRAEITYLKDMGFFDFNETGKVIINDIYLNELIDLNFSSISNRFLQYLKSKGDSIALLMYGLFFERIKDNIRAEKCFKEAISIYPNYANAYRRLGILYLNKADDESYHLKKSAREAILTSIKFFTTAIELKPHDYSYFLLLGYAYSKAAFIDDIVYHNKGNADQNTQRTIFYASKAIELNPNNSTAYRQRGFANLNLRNFKDAEKDYDTACKLNPNSQHIYYLLGMLYNEWEQYEKALDNYYLCISLKKDFFQAYNDIGYILSKKHQDPNISYTEKNNLAKNVTKNFCLSIWHSRGKHIVAYCNLGHFYIAIHEIRKAIKVQSIAIGKSPNYVEAYSARGYAYVRLHEYEQGEIDLLKAIELNPNSEKAISNLAFCYQQMGQVKLKSGSAIEAKMLFEKAIKYYDSLIIKNGEEQISARIGKAITLEKMGEMNSSYEMLSNLLKEDSSNPKILSSILRHLTIKNNNEQVLNFLTVLLESVKQKKILSINKQLLEECTKHLQRLSKIKILSGSLQELVELLKNTFPDNYFVFKVSGIFKLNKAILEKEFYSKLKFLSEAEEDFLFAKSITKNKPVFLKYLGVVNSNKCIAWKERANETKKPDDISKYKELSVRTNEMFYKAEEIFSDYPELYVEHAVFLYSNQIREEAQIIEKTALQLFANQLIEGRKDDIQIEEEIKELKEVKAHFANL